MQVTLIIVFLNACWMAVDMERMVGPRKFILLWLRGVRCVRLQYCDTCISFVYIHVRDKYD